MLRLRMMFALALLGSAASCKHHTDASTSKDIVGDAHQTFHPKGEYIIATSLGLKISQATDKAVCLWNGTVQGVRKLGFWFAFDCTEPVDLAFVETFDIQRRIDPTIAANGKVDFFSVNGREVGLARNLVDDEDGFSSQAVILALCTNHLPQHLYSSTCTLDLRGLKPALTLH